MGQDDMLLILIVHGSNILFSTFRWLGKLSEAQRILRIFIA